MRRPSLLCFATIAAGCALSGSPDVDQTGPWAAGTGGVAGAGGHAGVIHGGAGDYDPCSRGPVQFCDFYKGDPLTAQCPPCKPSAPYCSPTFAEGSNIPEVVAFCANDAFSENCAHCADERDVCANTWGSDPPSYDSYYGCRPRELCEQVVLRGEKHACRFTDYTAFTLDAIPDISPCPIIPGVLLCGGTCGSCPAGSACRGRSPTHPFGVCWTEPLSGECSPKCGDPAKACFDYATAEPGGWLAKVRRCLPKQQCIDLALGLPGGGACFDDLSHPPIAGSMTPKPL